MTAAQRREEQDHGRKQAAAQMRSVAAMVAALNVDYDELFHLQESIEELQGDLHGLQDELSDHELHGHMSPEERHEAITERDRIMGAMNDVREDIASEQADLAPLLEAADGCTDRDDALQRIQEDALSVEVRSGWSTDPADLQAEEFRIVLCTGGPHVEIQGDLDEYGTPTRARLLYSDWFQGLQDYHGESFDHDALLAYAGCFYFGEG